ncbi:hypothetical protein GCM10010282_62890 [Streptomyces roseolus]|nr:hypothetical protein GCM10010282_62890 [Streptomyces roseolus]
MLTLAATCSDVSTSWPRRRASASQANACAAMVNRLFAAITPPCRNSFCYIRFSCQRPPSKGKLAPHDAFWNSVPHATDHHRPVHRAPRPGRPAPKGLTPAAPPDAPTRAPVGYFLAAALTDVGAALLLMATGYLPH